jgi:hypothetical protein
LYCSFEIPLLCFVGQRARGTTSHATRELCHNNNPLHWKGLAISSMPSTGAIDITAVPRHTDRPAHGTCKHTSTTHTSRQATAQQKRSTSTAPASADAGPFATTKELNIQRERIVFKRTHRAFVCRPTASLGRRGLHTGTDRASHRCRRNCGSQHQGTKRRLQAAAASLAHSPRSVSTVSSSTKLTIRSYPFKIPRTRPTTILQRARHAQSATTTSVSPSERNPQPSSQDTNRTLQQPATQSLADGLTHLPGRPET